MTRPTPTALALDDADRSLLDGLQDDCKQSLASLGERVGLAAPTVLERIRRLEAAGLIRGYHAVLDARAAGLDIGAFIGVGIDHPRSIASYERAIRAMPEVLEEDMWAWRRRGAMRSPLARKPHAADERQQ